MTGHLFADAVIVVLSLAVVIAAIVALAVPVTERHERRQAMKRHPSGRHSHEFVHGAHR